MAMNDAEEDGHDDVEDDGERGHDKDDEQVQAEAPAVNHVA